MNNNLRNHKQNIVKSALTIWFDLYCYWFWQIGMYDVTLFIHILVMLPKGVGKKMLVMLTGFIIFIIWDEYRFDDNSRMQISRHFYFVKMLMVLLMSVLLHLRQDS